MNRTLRFTNLHLRSQNLRSLNLRSLTLRSLTLRSRPNTIQDRGVQDGDRVQRRQQLPLAPRALLLLGQDHQNTRHGPTPFVSSQTVLYTVGTLKWLFYHWFYLTSCNFMSSVYRIRKFWISYLFLSLESSVRIWISTGNTKMILYDV